MDDFFNYYDLRMYDKAFESVYMDIDLFFDYFTEASDDLDQKKMTIINKISEIIKVVKKKIQDFFTKKEVNSKIEKSEQIIKENPEIANEKVKITDYEKLDELNKNTLKELEKNDVDVEKLWQNIVNNEIFC